MAGPRLLEKKLVHASLATERKQEMDKGLKIAKAVDAIREMRATEEKKLEEWRVNTIKLIQSQIDFKQAENERLAISNKQLREERLRLESPIDLVQAWDEVHKLKEKNEYISDDLLKREISVTGRENEVHDASASLFEREREIIKLESAAQDNLRNSEEERSEAIKTNQDAKEILSDVKTKEAEFDKFARQKTQELELKESELASREESINEKEIDINSKNILLADRRATLERGFEELRRKQNGLHR